MSAATEKLLTPHNSAFVFIDHQPQMAFGVTNIDRQLLKNNVIAMAKTAKLFNIPSQETYEGATTIAREHFGAYGMGIDYAASLVHDYGQRTAYPHKVSKPSKAA